MRSCLFDAEANGFLETVTRIHVVCGIDLQTGERWRERNPSAALARLASYDRLIGHNILRYDLPVFAKLFGWKYTGQIRDTKVAARVIYPNVSDTDGALIKAGQMPAGNDYRGKHSIAAWGYRLGKPKLHEDITDWSEWTEDMEERCAGDCETNLALWDYLKVDEYDQRPIELEQRVDVVVWQMELAGVPFDLEAAGKLHTTLLGRRDELEGKLKKQFGFWFAPISPDPAKHCVTPKVNNAKRGITKGCPYTKLKQVHFNPRSNQHIERVLRSRGWVPNKFTPSGQAELTEQDIEAIVRAYPEMEGLGEYKMVQKRLGALIEGEQSLLNNVAADGRIHGVINPAGTTTGRASHFHPNLGQVPSLKKPYGHEFRSLFAAPTGWKVVGADQEGLEGRGLGHYLAAFDGGAYAQILLSGDPHWRSAVNLGLVAEGTKRDKTDPFHIAVREGAKRFFYALIYGAQPFKCGLIIYDICRDVRRLGSGGLWHKFFGNSADPEKDKLLYPVGEEARDRFIAGISGMSELQDVVASQVRKFKAIKGLDGRIIPTRSPHSAVNFLNQSCGAILCKRWLADAWDECCANWKHGWDGDFVFGLFVHDEIEVFCREALAYQIGEILVKHAKLAGQHYGLRVPLDSSYAIGRNWADVH